MPYSIIWQLGYPQWQDGVSVNVIFHTHTSGVAKVPNKITLREGIFGGEMVKRNVGFLPRL